MKRRIQIALAALLLAGLAGCGAPPPLPRCSSEDGQHKWGKWEVYGTTAGGADWIWRRRTCEICGWTERSAGE